MTDEHTERCPHCGTDCLELDELRSQVHDLGDALRAAVDGNLQPAEAFCAAAVLGVRSLDPDGVMLKFDVDLQAFFGGSIPRSGSFQTGAQLLLPERYSGMVVRRLYVDPRIASGFRLEAVYIGQYHEVLWGPNSQPGISCELFSKRYGSPRFEWKLKHLDFLEVKVTYLAGCERFFQMLALGHYTSHETTTEKA